MYDVNDFFERLTKLRTNKDISMRKMSLDLGQGESYMKEIESKSNYPSMTGFFNICDYLNMHPADFFDNLIEHPEIICSILDNLKKLNKEQLECIEIITRDLKK